MTMKKLAPLLAAVGIVAVAALAVPATADHDDGHIGTDPTFCHGSDLHIKKVTDDRVVFIGTKWPVDDGNPETKYYHWAEYITYKYVGDEARTRVDLNRVVVYRDNKNCLAYTVRGVVPYDGQYRVAITTFDADTGDWGGKGWYRHLPRR